MRFLFVVLATVGCGNTVRNLPQASNAARAGAAAAFAGALTLASPDDAEREAKAANEPDEDLRAQKPGRTLPTEALDSLDQLEPDPLLP